jgi:hypothetical protein
MPWVEPSDIRIEVQLVPPAWVDLTADVILSHGIDLSYGMGGGIQDRVASVGRLQFSLRNDAMNSGATLGWYSPHHANVRPGWTYNIPTRLAIDYGGVTYYWRGALDAIDPLAGQTGPRFVRCVAVDWMDEAARALNTVPIQAMKRGDEIITALFASMDHPPLVADLQTGLDTYPWGGDNIGVDSNILTTLHRLAMSGLDYIGVRRDTSIGQTFFYENRNSRLFDTSVLITLDETMHELVMGSTRAKVTNAVLTTVHPRRVDSLATTVVATLFG